jgi:hypothetical protein
LPDAESGHSETFGCAENDSMELPVGRPLMRTPVSVTTSFRPRHAVERRGGAERPLLNVPAFISPDLLILSYG